MSRRALALLFVAAFAPAAPVPKAKEANPYPFEVGTKWEYTHEGDEKKVVVEEITKSEEKDGVRTIRVDVKLADGKKTHEEFEIKGDEVWCLVSSGQKCVPPIMMYKAGAKAGDSWTNEYKVGRVAIKETVTVGKAEEVTTPAGKFTATPLTQSAGKTSASYVGWFVDGVGLVLHTVEGQPQPEQELKSFTPGKK